MKLDVRINRLCGTLNGIECAAVEIFDDRGEVVLTGDLFVTEHFKEFEKSQKLKAKKIQEGFPT